MDRSPSRSAEELRERRDSKRRASRRKRLSALALALVLGGAGAAASTLAGGGDEDHVATGVLGTAAEQTAGTTAAPPSPPPFPPPGPTPERKPPRKPPAEVTISATGDIALGRTGAVPPGGGRAVLARVRRPLDADVVLGNLETTLTTGGGSQCAPRSRDCYAFRAPPSYAPALARAGFTVLNLANNHSFDYGRQGAVETLAALRAAHLRHTGRPGEIAVVRVGRTRVAVLGFAPYKWAQSLLDLPAARRLVRRAARRADIVVVVVHAGAEGVRYAHVHPGPEYYLGERRGDPVAFAHAVVQAGADLVVGSGPHVLRGLEWYRGRLVAYSLGNFAGYRNFDLTGAGGVSAILRVTLRADGSLVEGSLVPIRLSATGTPVRDPRRAALATVRTLSHEDFGRRAVRVSPDGALRPPPR